MISIQYAYINALLADASYVTNVRSGAVDASEFKDRLTTTQANFLAANFTVVASQHSLGGGFDAVVWQIKAGSALAGPNNESAGRIFVSMRGTQEAADVQDDITLASKGIPYQQVADMVNWWLKNTAAVNNTEVKQIKVLEVPGMVGFKTFVLDAPTTGTGLLTELDGIAGVNGHSLGGYLATAFTRIFGGTWGVEKVSTFNSAGFSNAASLNISDEFNKIANLLGGNMGIGFDGLGAIQTNFFGDNGIEFTTNSLGDMRLPGFNQYGERVALYQEAVLSGGLDRIIANHYMYKLTDYLALGAVLEKFDGTMSFGKVNELVKAGSNGMKASYEGVLDALRRQLLGAGVTATPASDGDPAAYRAIYQANLKDFADSAAFNSLAGKVTITPVGGNIATQAQARLGFEEIAALQTLSPFVLNAVGNEGMVALDGLWQSGNWNSSYTAWLQDKSKIALGQTAVAFTDQWIADRSTLLGAIISRNVQDSTNANVASANVPTDRLVGIRYTDTGSGNPAALTVWNPANNGAKNALQTRPHQLVWFGSDQNDELTGEGETKFGDHLYGGGGDDTLNGKAGDDYIEGGIGTDTYIVEANSGRDTIVDADGLGLLKLADRVLTGSGKLQVSANPALNQTDTIWVDSTSAAQPITYRLDNTRTLTITGAGSTVTVQNFQSGNLGISAPQPPANTNPSPAVYAYDLGTPDGRAALDMLDLACNGAAQDAQTIAANAQFNANTTVNNAVELSGSGPWVQLYDEVATGDGDDELTGGAITPIKNLRLDSGEGNDFVYAGMAQTLDDAIAMGDDTQTLERQTSRYVLDGGAGKAAIDCVARSVQRTGTSGTLFSKSIVSAASSALISWCHFDERPTNSVNWRATA